MKDTLEQALQEILGTLIATKDFVIEQAPDVVQQLLAYKTILAVIGMTVSMVVLIVITIIAIWAALKFNDGGWYTFLLFNCFPTLIFFVNLTSYIKLTVAPKVYIIEYMSRLISGGRG